MKPQLAQLGCPGRLVPGTPDLKAPQACSQTCKQLLGRSKLCGLSFKDLAHRDVRVAGGGKRNTGRISDKSLLPQRECSPRQIQLAEEVHGVLLLADPSLECFVTQPPLIVSHRRQ